MHLTAFGVFCVGVPRYLISCRKLWALKVDRIRRHPRLVVTSPCDAAQKTRAIIAWLKSYWMGGDVKWGCLSSPLLQRATCNLFDYREAVLLVLFSKRAKSNNSNSLWVWWVQEQQNNWSVSFTLMDLLMLLSTRLEARNVELQGCFLYAVAILARTEWRRKDRWILGARTALSSILRSRAKYTMRNITA